MYIAEGKSFPSVYWANVSVQLFLHSSRQTVPIGL